jgi:uncharacterized protein YkwD
MTRFDVPRSGPSRQFRPLASSLCLLALALGTACSGDVGETATGSGSGGGSSAAQGAGGEDDGSGGDAAGPAGSGGAPAGVTTGSSTSDATTAASTSTGTVDPFCGDGTCDAGETCEACASDCGACSGCQGASDETTALDAEEQAFLVIINAYRAENGLGALAACTSLNRAAQGHSEDMRDQDYFDHVSLDGSSFTERTCDACYELGCSVGTTMGENIAAGNPGAEAVFEQWRTSPGHDENMRGSGYTQIGIGRATGGGTYGTYWTNVFAGDSEPSCE